MYRELRHFIVVIEEESITSAAERLGLTQPALSKSLRRLEEELGLELVERGPRGIRLTAAGAKVYARARVVEAEMRYLEFEAGRVRAEARRRLKIGVSPLWEIISVPEIVSTFHKRYSDVAISLDVDQKNRLVDKLAGGEIDFALCGTDVSSTEPGIGREPIARVELRVACSKSHPLMKSWSGDLEEIYRYSWIDYRFAVRRIRRELSGADDLRPRSVVETGSWLSGLLMAARGDYLLTLPHQLVEFAEGFGLSFIPGVPAASTFDAGIWYRKSALSTDIGKTFRSIARASMQRHGSRGEDSNK